MLVVVFEIITYVLVSLVVGYVPSRRGCRASPEVLQYLGPIDVCSTGSSGVYGAIWTISIG